MLYMYLSFFFSVSTCCITNATKINFTGSAYGLRLTLNIEDYEHVAGIGTNSGIKVYFNCQLIIGHCVN